MYAALSAIHRGAHSSAGLAAILVVLQLLCERWGWDALCRLTALMCAGAALQPLGLQLGDALFVHLYLADMACFSAANAAYARHFPAVNPPARACVQALLQPGCQVAVDVLLAHGEASCMPIQGLLTLGMQVLHEHLQSSDSPQGLGLQHILAACRLSWQQWVSLWCQVPDQDK